MNKRYDEKCPNCGKFVPRDADGFYDQDWDFTGWMLVVYCDIECADEARAKHPEDVKAFEAIHRI